MIDLRELDETIDELKRNGSTIGAAEKLALLYIAREHMEREGGQRMPMETARDYAHTAAPTPDKEKDRRVKTRGTSEFLAACDGARIEDVLYVLDEHMEAIKVLYPKEYDAIVLKLEELP